MTQNSDLSAVRVSGKSQIDIKLLDIVGIVFGMMVKQELISVESGKGFEPFEIMIIKKAIKGSSNKALGFELV